MDQFDFDVAALELLPGESAETEHDALGGLSCTSTVTCGSCSTCTTQFAQVE